MKKVLLLTIISIFFISVKAQITKGSVLLGGGISAFTTKGITDTYKQKNKGLFLSPSLGFAIKDNTVIGVSAGYGNANSFYSDSENSKTNSYNAGLFYRKYLPLGKSFYLFGEAVTGYYQASLKQVLINEKRNNKQSSIGLNLFPGITYAIGKRFHLETTINNLFSLSYSKSTTEIISSSNTTMTESNGVSLNANLSNSAPLTLGFRFVLGK